MSVLGEGEGGVRNSDDVFIGKEGEGLAQLQGGVQSITPQK